VVHGSDTFYAGMFPSKALLALLHIVFIHLGSDTLCLVLNLTRTFCVSNSDVPETRALLLLHIAFMVQTRYVWFPETRKALQPLLHIPFIQESGFMGSDFMFGTNVTRTLCCPIQMFPKQGLLALLHITFIHSRKWFMGWFRHFVFGTKSYWDIRVQFRCSRNKGLTNNTTTHCIHSFKKVVSWVQTRYVWY
jgi:hypothetical protein